MRTVIVLLLFLVIIFGCKKNDTVTNHDKEQTCINNKPVEDTTRVYLFPGSPAETLKIYPKAIFVRFYPSVTDTNKIHELLNKYNFILWHNRIDRYDDNYTALICLKNSPMRAEYHFTPYSKTNYCNFGTDSLVEYCFAVFDSAHMYPNGRVIIKFKSTVQQTEMDSIYSVYGLRFFKKTIAIPSGYNNTTIITPKAKKNVIDLVEELRSNLLLEKVYYDATFRNVVDADPNAPFPCQ